MITPKLGLCLSCLVLAVVASPVPDPVEIDHIEAGTRDEGSSEEGSFVAELRDSLVVPLLLNPFEVNKLTCGSIITFYDNSASSDVTVAVDLCLTALLIAKLLVVVPMLLDNIDTENIEGGVFGIFDKIGESLARLDLAGSGPEGEPFENPVSLALNKFSQEEESKPENMEILAAFKESPVLYEDDQGYVGFGFDGWQSGAQSFPDLTHFAANNLPRSFPTGKIEKLLISSLHKLDQAITIERKKKD